MLTLLREHRHQLLKRLGWSSQLKVYLQSITLKQIASEWSIVVRVVPSPGYAVLIVVGVYPAQAFDIGLLDLLAEVLGLCFSRNMKLLKVVPLLPSSGSKQDLVHILTSYLLTPLLQLLADDSLDMLLCKAPLRIFTQLALLEHVFNQELLLVVFQLLCTQHLLLLL